MACQSFGSDETGCPQSFAVSAVLAAAVELLPLTKESFPTVALITTVDVAAKVPSGFPVCVSRL